jgi:hypothetical protein
LPAWNSRSFVHETLIRETQQDRPIGHIARDATAIEARVQTILEPSSASRCTGTMFKINYFQVRLDESPLLLWCFNRSALPGEGSETADRWLG